MRCQPPLQYGKNAGWAWIEIKIQVGLGHWVSSIPHSWQTHPTNMDSLILFLTLYASRMSEALYQHGDDRTLHIYRNIDETLKYLLVPLQLYLQNNK